MAATTAAIVTALPIASRLSGHHAAWTTFARGARTSGVSASVTKSGFGLNGGIGFRFPLGGMSTFLEGRYHYIMTKDDNQGVPNTAFIPISFGVMF